MRVAVDATPLLVATSGVPAVTRAIIDGLAGRPEIELTAFAVSARGRRRLPTLVPSGVATVGPPLPARALRRLWARGDRPTIDRFIGRHDLVHGPNFVVPPSRAARVMTVHDLTPVRYPELCHPDTLAYPRLIERAAAQGAWIHVVSHAVADEVIATLSVDPERVVAIPNGFTPVRGDAAKGRAAAGRHDYVLAVGTVEPRKDLPGLLRAIDAIATDHADLHLVHAGGDGWGLRDFEAAHASMHESGRVHRLGRVDDATLADLYAGARLVAYPSVYEGFGLPVLEAMSAGTPVVSSDVPAIAEVAGDAAVLVPVGDSDALAEAIGRVWTDAALRAQLVDRGLVQAATFTWSAAIDGLVALYRRAVGASG